MLSFLAASIVASAAAVPPDPKAASVRVQARAVVTILDARIVLLRAWGEADDPELERLRRPTVLTALEGDRPAVLIEFE